MSDGVMIAFIPTNAEWCRQPDPHMTLVYCGKIGELPVGIFNDLAKAAISVARLTRSFSLDVMSVEVFGDDEEKVDVLRLSETSQLLLARQLVEPWNASQHPFSAHVTIGPEGSASGMLPTNVYFAQIMVAWGNRQLVFPLTM